MNAPMHALGGIGEYVPGLTFSKFLGQAAIHFPALADMIDPDRAARIDTFISAMNRVSWEFEADGSGGRGVAYNVAQRASRNRAQGMTSLLSLFSPSGHDMPGPDTVILDALAGDGTISRFAAELDRAPTIISADLSGFMVAQCVAQNLPCIRQSASASLMRDGVLDGVLIAYGSHHLPAPDRRQAAHEAYRTLRRGGRFVLHDFEEEGPVARWFSEVVHPYSITGHPHPHFTREEMADLLDEAGFDDPRVFEMADPFTLDGTSADDARNRMLTHLYNMYGLAKLPFETDADRDALERLVEATLGPIAVEARGDGWTARLRRPALVAMGTR